MIAVVPVRAGELPAGGAEAAATSDGRVLLVGSGTAAALSELGTIVSEAKLFEAAGFEPGAWAGALAGLLAEEALVVLPASPDGRDLAPRLAAVLGHDLLCGATEIRGHAVHTAWGGGTAMVQHHLDGATVVTLEPGVRGVDPVADRHENPPVVESIAPPAPTVPDPSTLEVLPPDASTMDLAEAPRIIAGGNGLPDPGSFERLGEVARNLDASVGTTRVITDKGWLPHERQIGTTGVVVDPRLYVAFGISGAVQHTSGLGAPDHVISVNTDPHCPMMSLADLAVVSDAAETLSALHDLLEAEQA